MEEENTRAYLQKLTQKLEKKKATFSRLIFGFKTGALLGFPGLIYFYNSLDKMEFLIAVLLYIAVCIGWLFSQRAFNHNNIRLNTNLWMEDMQKYPGKFERYLSDNNLK